MHAAAAEADDGSFAASLPTCGPLRRYLKFLFVPSCGLCGTSSSAVKSFVRQRRHVKYTRVGAGEASGVAEEEDAETSAVVGPVFMLADLVLTFFCVRAKETLSSLISFFFFIMRTQKFPREGERKKKYHKHIRITNFGEKEKIE